MHRTKNRLLAIPAETQAALNLERRPENDILLVSIRGGGVGRWNHHYVKLTFDNEFAIPADVAGIAPGDHVEVKVHAVYSGTPKAGPGTPAGAGVLVALASAPRPGWRRDGSANVDAYLDEDVVGDRVR